MNRPKKNLIDCIALTETSKRELERRIAEMALGVATALQNGEMSFEQAWLDLFNIDNFQALRRRRLDRRLIELFDWAMELEDVVEVTPSGAEESYKRIAELAGSIIRKSTTSAGKIVSAAGLRRSA